jgi:hypothetical protein
MKSIRIAGLLLLAVSLHADVKTQEKNQVQFEGMMGRMAGMFGGKAAREGAISTVAVKGNRKMTVNDNTGRIIDLDEEKVYELDMRNKSYRVTTFAELRRRMQEAQEKAKGRSRETAEPSKKEPGEKGEKEMEIDFDLKESGQKKTINGYDCREVVMTVTVHEKGKTLQQSGGMVLTSHDWLAPRIAAMKEIGEFDRKYAEKLAGTFSFGDAQQMAAAMAMYPYMKEAIGKFQAENVNMNGTAILMTMTMESVASPEDAAQQQKEKEKESTTDVTSVGGLLGGLGRKLAKKKQEPESSEAQGRAEVMTMNHELLKVSTDVGDADLAIPAGFKEKK